MHRIAALAFAMGATLGSLHAQQPSPPLAIDQAVEEAVKNNLGLLAERQNVPVSKAREITAALRPNPVFNFAWDYLDWLRRGLTVENSAGPSEWNTHLDYPIEAPGKRARRIDLAHLIISVTELRLLDSIRQLQFSVRMACVDYLLAKENLELANQNLRVLEQIVSVNEARERAGDLAGVEVIRVRVARQQSQNNVQQASLRLATARNNVAQLLGRKGGGSSVELAGTLQDSAVLLLLEELRVQALQQRPDLLAQRKDTERASADTRLQTVNAKPDYTVSTVYHHQYGYSNGRTFGVYLAVPLPIHNRNQGEILRAQRETQQSAQRGAALESSITTEVENAWLQYQTSQRLLEQIRGSMLAEARQVRDVTEFSYRRGEASLLEFLDAQRAFNDSMQSYNEARADYMKSLFLLDSVTGKSVNP